METPDVPDSPTRQEFMNACGTISYTKERLSQLGFPAVMISGLLAFLVGSATRKPDAMIVAGAISLSIFHGIKQIIYGLDRGHRMIVNRYWKVHKSPELFDFLHEIGIPPDCEGMDMDKLLMMTKSDGDSY